MDSKLFDSQCWKYYLALEDDFRKIERYVTFESENLNCFSIEFIKQFQAICSEIDVVCKMYCEFLSPTAKRKSIMHYANVILSYKKDFTTSEINLKDDSSSLTIQPWIDWSCSFSNFEDGKDAQNNSPVWWNIYNKVKHQRLDKDDSGVLFYRSATLGNTINALAALFVLEMNFYKDLVIYESKHTITIPSMASKLFTFKDWEPHIIHLDNGIVLSDN